MSREVERLALADAMQLHDERVQLASDAVSRLRHNLEVAKLNLDTVVRSRKAFMDAVRAEGATP